VGLGAGFALGNQMAGAMSDAMRQSREGGGGSSAAGAGAAGASAGVACPKCGNSNNQGAKFCTECGTKLGAATCPNCQAEVPAGAKFCNECGTKI
jgi:membrane protease subunit (stomatin/prohibitin family)